MSAVEKSLDSIGLKTHELGSLDQTDSLILCRIFVEIVLLYMLMRRFIILSKKMRRSNHIT